MMLENAWYSLGPAAWHLPTDDGDDDGWVGSIGGMTHGRGELKYWEGNLP
jgi:hypothetical protein